MNEAGCDYDALMADATRLSEASDSPRLHAQRAWRVIRGAEEGRTALRVLQVRVVAKVAREELWKHHPNNYPTLREFLKAACGSSAHSVPNELNAVGALVLFCEEHHIGIDKYLDDQTWAKLREALPALRRARIQGDAPTVKAILDDVKRIKTREAARRKYRRSRVKLARA